jgi:hypothetical protein
LIALDAPVEDRVSARLGKLSTNELVRRSKSARVKRAERNREKIALEQEKQTQKTVSLIRGWIDSNHLAGCEGERIIDLVRHELFWAEQEGRIKPDHKPIELPTERIIELCKPKLPIGDNAETTSWYAEWLSHWVLWAFEPIVRDNALDQVLQMEWAR